MSIKDLEEVKSTVADPKEVKKHDGEKVKIAGVEEMEVNSQYSDRGKQWVLRVYSEPIEVGESEITASSLFNLTEENGQPTGWSSNGNLKEFLDRVGVKHPKDLKGKKALVKAKPSNDGSMTFLEFVK